MKKEKNKFKIFINKNLYLLLIIVATLFMSIGYATVNNVTLDLDGTSNIKSHPGIYITDATITGGTNGTQTDRSSINMLYEDIMKSRIVLGNNQNATLTMSITMRNTTSDKTMFTGVTYSNNFYDNNLITYTISGLNNEDVLNPGASKTFTITFSYASNDISNDTLNSYLKFNFEKFYTITYQNIDTTNKNYPTYILDGETTKTVTFTGDVPYDVDISPSVSYTYNSPTLTLNNIVTDITINRYYSITYNLDGGTNPSNPPDRYLHGASVTLPTPTKTNSTFGGWYTNSGFTGNAVTTTSGLSTNLTLYAKWSSSTYQVATSFITSMVGDASDTSTDVITLTPPTGGNCTNTLAYDGTTDKNLRFVGANPCNYVKFNCDGSGNCETWRIVGVVNELGSTPVLKLTAPIPATRTWDTKNAKVWANSALKTYLNDTYLNGLNSGVQSNYLLNADWNAGTSAYNTNPTTIYNDTKNTKVTAYIGLISPADYAFSSAGGTGTSRSTCISSNMSSFAADCYNNSWIFTGANQWTITAQGNGNGILRINTNGTVQRANANQAASQFRPTVFIKGDIKINTTKAGSESDPYELQVGS